MAGLDEHTTLLRAKKQFLLEIERLPLLTFVDSSIVASIHERVVQQIVLQNKNHNEPAVVKYEPESDVDLSHVECPIKHESSSEINDIQNNLPAENDIIDFIDLASEEVQTVSESTTQNGEINALPPTKRRRYATTHKLTISKLANSLHRATPLIDITSPIQISLITADDILPMQYWASANLSVEACRAFGTSLAVLSSRKYWREISKETGFKITYKNSIIGYVHCSLSSLDLNGVPAHYGAIKRSRVVHHNMACLSYIKSNSLLPVKGCMRQAMEMVIEWLLQAEPQLSGVMAVIRQQGSSYESSLPETREYIRRSRALALAVGMQELPEFHGRRMGVQNAFVLLRNNIMMFQ